MLGDGINHLLTTGAGDIWVGYFDEGVFGDFGWGGHTEPLGACGIARFDEALDQVWTYPSGRRAPPVDDCYALNVTDTQVWARYYSDFPVARIIGDGRGQARSARRPRSSPKAPESHCSAGIRRTVTGDHFEPEVTTRLTLPGGAPVTGVQPVARGDELHLLGANRWWKVSLDQIGAR